MIAAYGDGNGDRSPAQAGCVVHQLAAAVTLTRDEASVRTHKIVHTYCTQARARLPGRCLLSHQEQGWSTWVPLVQHTVRNVRNGSQMCSTEHTQEQILAQQFRPRCPPGKSILFDWNLPSLRTPPAWPSLGSTPTFCIPLKPISG